MLQAVDPIIWDVVELVTKEVHQYELIEVALLHPISKCWRQWIL
jgi:hypothetical protein